MENGEEAERKRGPIERLQQRKVAGQVHGRAARKINEEEVEISVGNSHKKTNSMCVCCLYRYILTREDVVKKKKKRSKREKKERESQMTCSGLAMTTFIPYIEDEDNQMASI